jgi:hypothetical protein
LFYQICSIFWCRWSSHLLVGHMMGKVFSMGGIQHLGMPAYFSFSFYIVTAISSTKVDFSLIITPIFIFALEFLESHSNLMNIKNSQQ